MPIDVNCRKGSKITSKMCIPGAKTTTCPLTSFRPSIEEIACLLDEISPMNNNDRIKWQKFNLKFYQNIPTIEQHVFSSNWKDKLDR